MLKLSVTTETSCDLFGDEIAFKIINKAGFSYADCTLYGYNENSEIWEGDNWKQIAINVFNTAQKANISFCQTHAPFPSNATNESFNAIKKAIYFSAQIGSPYVVVHPIIPLELNHEQNRQIIFNINKEFFGKLGAVAKESGVKIAIENMFRYDKRAKGYVPTMCSDAKELAELIDALGEEFCACVDTGHSNLYGYTFSEVAKTLGARMQVLHIHDNMGYEDEHTLPFLGNIDWARFCEALKQMNFGGVLSFETLAFEQAMPKQLYEQALCFIYETGKFLAQQCI